VVPIVGMSLLLLCIRVQDFAPMRQRLFALICVTHLWDSWMHPQAVAGAPDVHGCLTEPIEHYATGKFMYMCHLLHDCTRCAVT